MIHLLLFDVDGVLVDARGYLKALQDTVAHFSRRMGLGALPPTEEEVRTFEANGMGSEWDSGAACVAQLLLERLRREPPLPLPPTWPEALATLAARPLPLPHPDYTAMAEKIGRRLAAGRTGAAQAARDVLGEQARETLRPSPAVPSLRENCGAPSEWRLLRENCGALLDALLGRTWDFYTAPVTRHFQHLVIGSEAVAGTYDVAVDFESPAYLRRYDRPLLSPDIRERLHEATADNRVGIALYTARPSLPPVEAEDPATGYSPEAEMARSLVGLERYPIVGLGKVHWLARRTGEETGRLIKPSPVQALAAIGAARSGQEAASLEAALALHRDGELRPPLEELGPAMIHAFEDIPGGLTAARGAVEALRTAGADVAWQPYGIAPADGPKAAAMAARGVPTYPSINEALQVTLTREVR